MSVMANQNRLNRKKKKKGKKDIKKKGAFKREKSIFNQDLQRLDCIENKDE